MNEHQQLIQRFYQAFQNRDAAAMNACYHQDIEFSDPVFVGLKGDEARAMWDMLCSGASDLKLEFDKVQADERQGSAHWQAWYAFSQTGHQVHNVIDAEFEFADGLIIRHTDRFDLHRWCTQALGPVGRLLGGFGFFQNALRKKVRTRLAAWQRRPG